MARDGLFQLLRAGVVCGALPWFCSALVAGPNEEHESPIAATLAVQTALQQGREQARLGNYQSAVQVLESQIARINGSSEYLRTLGDAYRSYIKELRLAGKDAEAEEYLKRLRIIDRGALSDQTLARGAAAMVPAPSKPAAETSGAPPKGPTARGKMDDDPFRPENAVPLPGDPLLVQAGREFGQHHYDEAGRLFEKASLANQTLTAENKECWAYCKLHHVYQELKQPTTGGPTLGDLEREVRLALDLAPRLQEYGKSYLQQIQDRRATAPDANRGNGQTAAVVVRHLDRPVEGWYVAETTNFRIYHNQQRDLVERVAQAAEATRTAMHRKWFTEAAEDWAPRCDLYLHRSAQEYSQATGVPANSPGHSTFRSESGRIIARRMDLHCDDANMLAAVLPHETTHVVLAGKFGDTPVPRWADEGMAVLTEPRDKIERHLRQLPQFAQDHTLLSVRQIMQLNDYPEGRYISAFYAQSVSLVEFLSREKGPQELTQFLREGMHGGYEAALRRHYGIQDFSDLEQRWQQYALGAGKPLGVAERGR